LFHRIALIWSKAITKTVLSSCLLYFATDIQQQACFAGGISQVLTRTTLLTALSFILVSWISSKIFRPGVTIGDRSPSPSACYGGQSVACNVSRRLHKVEQNFKMGNLGKRDKKRKRPAGDLSGDDCGNPFPVYQEERRRKRPAIVKKHVCFECGMQPRTRSMTE
jgi:hypothetical protein